MGIVRLPPPPNRVSTLRRRHFVSKHQDADGPPYDGDLMLVHDNFTDDDNTKLTDHTIGPVNTQDLAWIFEYGTNVLKIQNNAVAPPSTSCIDILEACGYSDVIVQLEMTRNGPTFKDTMIVGRWTAPAGEWEIRPVYYSSTTRLHITEYNGSRTTRAEVNLPGSWEIGETHILKGKFEGTTIRLYLDGIYRCQYTSATFNLTEERFGIRAVSTGFGGADDFYLYGL